MTPPRRSPPPEEKSYADMSAPQLKKVCDGFGLEYTKTAKKPRLLEIIDEYENPPREIDRLLKDVAENMGDGVVTLASAIPLFRHIPSGSFLLDLATGGGFTEGCGHMVYGWEGCGKTTLWLLVAASTQRKYSEGVVVWVDPEDKLDPQWAVRLGVDLDRMYVVKPKSGEAAVDVMEAAARSIEVVAIFLDSIPSLCPTPILEKSAEDTTVASRARLVGILCSKIQQAWIDEGARGHRFTFFFINQFRFKIGVIRGDPRTLPGGMFQNYLADSKLELKKKEIFSKVEDEGQARHISNEHAFKFPKTKCVFSIKSGETTMVMNDVGRKDGLTTGCFDDCLTVCTYAKMRGLITGGGASWYVHGIDQKFNKRESIIAYLKSNPQDFLRLKQLLIMIQRRESKLTDVPPDGFLLDWITDERAQLYGQVLDDIGFGNET